LRIIIENCSQQCCTVWGPLASSCHANTSSSSFHNTKRLSSLANLSVDGFEFRLFVQQKIISLKVRKAHMVKQNRRHGLKEAYMARSRGVTTMLLGIGNAIRHFFAPARGPSRPMMPAIVPGLYNNALIINSMCAWGYLQVQMVLRWNPQ